MEKFHGFIEKVLISVISGLVIIPLLRELLKKIVPSLPEISLCIGSKVIIGPPYFFFLASIIGIYLILSTILSGRIGCNRKLGQVCKQFQFYSQVCQFASNGIAKYKFIRRKKLPCIKIELQNYNLDFANAESFTTSADCGIIFRKSPHLFAKGFLISDKEKMCFDIMGNEGGEELQIGIGFKNIHGHEQKFTLSKFLKGEIEKDIWKEIEIDLGEFAFVTRSADDKVYLENFNIFTNSKLSGTKRIVVYIRNIEFIPARISQK